jgi:predicted RNA-binding protein with PUA-like domain
MAHWLFKSEPSAWSWDDQVKAGATGTCWSGVRNHQAKLNLMAMKLGDLGFFYHSNVGKEIVGIVTVIKEYYPDPSDASGRFGMVDIKAQQKLPRAVSLAEIKASAKMSGMALVTSTRLSVQPVTNAEWDLVCHMAGLAKAP